MFQEGRFQFEELDSETNNSEHNELYWTYYIMKPIQSSVWNLLIWIPVLNIN